MRNAIIATGAILSISVLLLAGCGQMGPLYSPNEAEAGQTKTENSTTTEPSS